MTYTYQQIEKAYSRLPEDIKESILHLDPEGTIGQIGAKHGLHVDEIGELADATALVMIGLEPMAEFIKELEARLKLTPEKTRAIADDINAEIFVKIRESLRQLSETPAGAGTTNNNQAAGETGGEETAPAEAGSADGNLFAEKMGKLFRLPREEVDLEMAKEKTIDPYLEPIE